MSKEAAPQTDLQYLDRLMTILKRHGATHFDDGSFRIDLAAVPLMMDPFKRPTAEEAAEEDEEERLYRKQLADWQATQSNDPDRGLDDGLTE